MKNTKYPECGYAECNLGRKACDKIIDDLEKEVSELRHTKRSHMLIIKELVEAIEEIKKAAVQTGFMAGSKK